jgi:Zn-dependent protease with chaperone function
MAAPRQNYSEENGSRAIHHQSANLFSTHPATENRVAALEAIAAGHPSDRKS